MPRLSTIGIIGGMGPDATNRLCDLITRHTDAQSDQEHIPVISFNNSLIPSRVESLSGGGESCLPEMIRTAKILEQAGADFLLLPCNTAHAYFNQLQLAVDIPITNMIDETARCIASEFPNVDNIGLLATTATIECRLYEDALEPFGKTLILPDEIDQEKAVMEAIFGRRGVKAGYRAHARSLLLGAGVQLLNKGAQVIIAGCTEVSLALHDLANPPFVVIDPLVILAKFAVKRATIKRSDAFLDPLLGPVLEPFLEQEL